MKASPAQTTFNGGEISPYLEGRIDIDSYANSCRRLRDLIPLVQGPITKRPPTQYINTAKLSDSAVRLIPFQFSIEQAYVLEFGDNYFRVYKDNGVVLDGAGPAIYEVVTPYGSDELFEMYYAQQNDVMLIAHPNHPPHRLSRFDHDDWLLEEYETLDGPFLDQNLTATTVTPSAETGSITLTASAPVFTPQHIGAYWRISELIASQHEVWVNNKPYLTGDRVRYGDNVYEATNAATSGTIPPVHTSGTVTDGAVSWLYLHSGSGYVQITGFTSATVVAAVVINRLPSTTATELWSEGAWSEYRGYPQTVAFYESRLFWAGTLRNPQTIWGSRIDEYNNYGGGSADDASLRYTISTDRVNAIKWLAPGKVMAVGTSGGEFTMSGNSINDALTPSNVRIVRETTYGSEGTKPVIIGSRVLFVQRGGQKMRQYVYEYDNDAYTAADLTVKSDILPIQGMKEYAFQQSPYEIVWIVRKDGGLLGMTYNKEQKVQGWHLHQIAQGQVESVAVIPDDVSNEDQVWLLVKRTINGSVQRHVEILRSDQEVRTGSNVSGYAYVDSQLSYSGSPVDTLSGLDHLEGESVGVLADGSYHPDVTVASGSIQLQREASEITVGLRYTPYVETLNIEAGAADGVAQGKIKRINNIVFRVDSTTPGTFYGPDEDTMYEVHTRSSGDSMDAPVPPFTGDLGPQSWPGGYEKKGRVRVEHRGLGAFTLLALFPQVTTQDR